MRWPAATAVLLFALPANADSTLWKGQSIALRVIERGVICEAGDLGLTLDGDMLKATLSANGAELTGALKPNGTLQLNGRKGARIYSFTGTLKDNAMHGSWIEAGSGCGGTWSAEPYQPDQRATSASMAGKVWI